MPRVRRFERAFYTTKARWLKLTSCRESKALCGQSWPTQNATAAVARSGGSVRNVARLDCCNAQLVRQCDRVCSVSARGVHEAARLYRGTSYCRVGTRGARRNLEQASAERSTFDRLLPPPNRECLTVGPNTQPARD